MQQKTIELNEFISKQIVSILTLTKQNIEQTIDFLQKQQTPYLNDSSVRILNILSANTVESFNKVLIDTKIGNVEDRYIVLTKYFEFDTLSNGVKKIPYSLLFVERFILIEINFFANNEKQEFILVPAQYELGENTTDVISNLEAIIESINLNIKLYDN